MKPLTTSTRRAMWCGKKFFVGACLGVAISTAFWMFVFWDFNPGNYGEEARVLVALTTVVAGFSGATIAHASTKGE